MRATDRLHPTLTAWTRGAPPAEGWWIASTSRDPACRRYWHAAARRWSAPVFVGDPDRYAELAKATRGESGVRSVEWRGLRASRAA
jgi:hypothetical protein